MTATPRTDAEQWVITDSDATGKMARFDVVEADFARELEAENKRLRKALQGIVDLDDGDEPVLWKFHDAFHDAIEALK